jgi:hypothetical protein
MKKTFWKNVLTALTTLMLPVPAFAELFNPCDAATTVYEPVSACDPIYSSTPTCDAYASYAGNPKSLWNFGGWIEAGGYGNAYGQKSSYNTNGATGFDPSSGNTSILYNVDHQTYFQMNQAWVYLEKQVSGQGLDVGGRIDLAYGTDSRYLEMPGLEIDSQDHHWGSTDYSLAFAQLYGEIGWDKLSVKVGKFLSPLGYEVIQSPDRFFYSMSDVFAHPPTTLAGAVASYQLTDDVSVYSAWGNTSFFSNSRDNAYVGGINWQVAQRLGLSYGVIVGANSFKDTTPTMNYFIQSVVANLQLTDRWNYVFEWTLQNNKQDGAHTGYYGINQELFYKLNNHWSVGTRYEWLHFYNDALYDNTDNTDTVNAITLGLNWKPSSRFTLRPEIRYDSVKTGTPFNVTRSNGNDLKGHQFSFGMSGIVTF